MTKNKSNLIKGTAILTIAGILTRVIGFFYRIYLSKAMGAENLGIYHLIFPIYGICFTIFASGIQTAISTLVAKELGRNKYQSILKVLRNGIIMSVGLAIVLAVGVYHYSDLIAANILREPVSASSLRILALAFPFCGITSCINGYYYGLKKAGIPASTQLLEQVVRVIFVYFAASYAGGGDIKVTCDLAVFGLVVGEIASQIFNVLSMYFNKTSKSIKNFSKTYKVPHGLKESLTLGLVKMTIPLTANRLLISILHSVEAILIPTMLKKSGLSNSEALSVYGVLTGMSIPFIMFPSAITNSLAVLLLPTISEAQSAKNHVLIQKTTAISIKYSMLIGILSAGLFITFGKELGILVYHNELSGTLLATIAWLCPLLYIATTFSSIINGLGLAYLTFFSSVIGLSARILLIVSLVPRQGMNGYLISFLISQLIMTFFEGFIVIKKAKPSFGAFDWIVKPGLIVAICGYFLHSIYEFIPGNHQGLGVLMVMCVVLASSFLIFLRITNAISLKDFK